MFEKDPLQRQLFELNAVAAALPDLIEDTLLISEAVEHAPISFEEAERSLFSSLKNHKDSRREIVLALREAEVTLRLSRLAVCFDHLIPQIEALLSGKGFQTPTELVQQLSRGLREARPIESVNLNVLQERIPQFQTKLDQVQSTLSTLSDTSFSTFADVTLGESEALLTLDPNDSQAHFDKGYAFATNGDLNGALVSFKRAYELSPAISQNAYFLAKCLHDLKQDDEALTIVEKAVKLDQSNPVVLTLKGSIHEALGQSQKAADAYLRSIKVSRGQGPLESNKALIRLSADPSIAMPRVRNAQVPSVDTRFIYEGFHRHEANCRIRIFRQEGGAIVLATWDKDSKGTSITNCAESLAMAVSMKFHIPLDGLIWVQHYEKSMLAEQALNTVHFRIREGQLQDPVWKDLTFQDFENMTGYRLLWGTEH